ncbi:conserved exported hypothetical protein [Candidatus Sulfopaludibacter sp. SbA3]|nr:conserved exported hypothetical protein [Candidatus Sulfopaludibacter sp. SbA3]
MSHTVTAIVLSAGLATLTCQAQTAPIFDVASVKPSEVAKSGGKDASIESITPSPNGLTMSNVSLLSCIRWGYNVQEYQISGPGWLGSQRYDIAAKAAAAVPVDDLRKMLQAMLADRFKLTLHRENKDLPVYALVPAKGGAKLEEAKTGSPPVFKVSGGSLVFESFTLAEMADRLSAGAIRVDRPILDKTGLTARYDFSLKVADSIADLKRSLAREQDPAVYIASLAVLGLKLEPRKGSIEALVIDHAEKVPTGN